MSSDEETQPKLTDTDTGMSTILQTPYTIDDVMKELKEIKSTSPQEEFRNYLVSTRWSTIIMVCTPDNFQIH